MKKIFALLIFASLSFSQPDPVAVDLANAERAFSTASEKYGIKESFLQFLSDDCVMFNPYPVNGKDLYRSRPENSALLTWYPTFVEVSASGDFGISTGPWEYRKSKNDENVSYGHYFSVWKKQSDGTWKVTVDNGINYPKEKKQKENDVVTRLIPHKINKNTGENTGTELLDAEHAFIQSVKKNGIVKSYEKFAASNMQVFRQGTFPVKQKENGIKYIKNASHQTDFSPMATQIASSGDLGYTYGFSVDAKKDSSGYIRVWRKEKGWKIAFDLLESFKRN